MPRTIRLDGLGQLLEKQSSVVSRGQLLALGMKDNTMQYRVRLGGPWQVLLRIIVLHFSPRELRREPAKVAEMIKGALNRGLTRPPLPIRTVPCSGSIQ